MESSPTLFSLFESTSIPVLICRENGIVVFKNTSAVRFLPGIRKRANAFTRAENSDFLSSVKDGKPDVICFHKDFSFKRALVFSLTTEEETFYPLLFFSLLQLNDYEKVVAQIQEIFSSDFLAFFATSKRTEYMPRAAVLTPARLYDELIGRICGELGMRDDVCLCDVGDFLLQIKERIVRPLAALGYRITFSPTKAFLENRFATLDMADLSFLFFRSLYAVLTHSRSRNVEIKADYPPMDYGIVLEIATDSDLTDGQKLTFDSLVPEYAWETAVLRSVPLFSELFTFSVKCGILKAESRLPHDLTASSPMIRSVNYRVSYAKTNRMMDTMLSMLKNHVRALDE